VRIMFESIGFIQDELEGSSASMATNSDLSDAREFELIQPDIWCSASANKGTTEDEW